MTSLVLLLAAVPLGAAFVALCLQRPMTVALPVYAALIPFGGAISLGPSRYGSASSLMGAVLAAGLVLRLLLARRDATRIPAPVPVWFLFLGLTFATLLWTVNRSETTSGLAVLTSLVVVYVLAAVSEVDRAMVRRVEDGLMVGAVAAVGYGLYQLVFLGGFVSDRTGVDIETEAGRFGNGMLGPNIESISLLLPFAIGLHRMFDEQETRGGRWWAGTAASLAMLGVFMTGSRTGTLAAGLVILVMALSSRGRVRGGMLTALGIGAVVATFVWVFQPLGLTERTFASATSSSGRLDIWKVGLQACKDYCSLGSGWGTFPDVYAETQALVPGARVLTGEGGSYQPHNLWLLALIETGVLGVVLFTAGLVITLRDGLRLPTEFRARAVGSLLGLAFGVIFLSSMEFKIFWMVLLMTTLYGNVVHAEQRARGRPAEPAWQDVARP